MRRLSNGQLFELYNSDLALRIRNVRNLKYDRALLVKFRDHLGEFPPSPELAKSFLARYTGTKHGTDIKYPVTTLARYASTIKAFMKWYGESLDDLKIRVPKILPPYTEDSDIDKLIARIENKKTHKATIVRDILLVELARSSGMREDELAKFEVGDLHTDFLVAHGKGNKDRIIPLTSAISARLRNFTKGTSPGDKVFGLATRSIGNKIRYFANKAGVNNIHAHVLRHKFATDLLERGANIKQVQVLMGHNSLGTTESYLSITDKSIRDAVNLLETVEKPNNTLQGFETITVKVPRKAEKLSKRQQRRSQELEDKLFFGQRDWVKQADLNKPQ